MRLSIVFWGLSCAVSLQAHTACPVAGGAQDSLFGNVEGYARAMDSLLARVRAIPEDSLSSARPCATTAALLCRDDRDSLISFLESDRRLAADLAEQLCAGPLLPRAYSRTFLLRIQALNRQKWRFPQSLAQYPVSRSYDSIHSERIFPIFSNAFASLAVASNGLLEEKYLSGSDEGNFFEGYLNGFFPFTRTNPDPTVNGRFREFGVSPWEILSRIEPVYLAARPGDLNVGGLLALSGLYHFFPDMIVSEDQAVTEKNTFASEWIRKAGPKLGVGVYGLNARWVAGGGVQLGFFSLWGLYDFHGGDFRAAFGLSDLSALKSLLPFFNK